MNPRRVAHRVLMRLEATPKRLEALLDGELSRHARAEARDRAMAANLVYAVLRHRARLDHYLQALVRGGIEGLDPAVLNLLRLGAAEVAVLGVPDHAAVHQAVELAKALGLLPAAKLVNAVLRRLAREWRGMALPGDEDPAGRLAVAHSHPRWLVEELLARWPQAEVEAWLRANQVQPPLGIRVNTLRASRPEVAALLAPHAAGVGEHPLSPEALVLTGAAGPAHHLPGFAQGLWQVQDPGATALTHLLGARPGLSVLDLCAGAGGKTGHLAALMANQGRLVAVEPAAGRVQGLKENMARLGADMVEAVQGDGTALADEIGPFDRILVDAPCTGLGTAGRRPDLRWRKDPGDAHRLAGLQLKLLNRAADLLKPGGALLYATCTVTRAENEEVVAALLARRPEMRREWDRAAAGAAAGAIGEDGFFRTLPHRHGCDAFFAVRIVRD